MTDSSTRIAIVTAALVGAFILAADLVSNVWDYLYSTVVFVQSGDEAANFGALTEGFGRGLIGAVIAAAIFGAGVFASLRWVAPIAAADGWKRVIVRGVIAAAIGAVASLVLAVLVAVIGSIDAGRYPLGYDFDPSINSDFAENRVVAAIGGAPGPFLEWLPLVVLAVVLLRLWLARRTATVANGSSI